MVEVKSIRTRLRKMEGSLLPNVPSKQVPLNIDVNHICRVENVESGLETILTLETKVGPTPSSLFQLNFLHTIHVQWQKNIEIEMVKSQAYTLCEGLGNELSFMSGFMSFELIGTHIIIPPNLNKEGFKIL